ncbi:MAG: hypothetical protein K8S98_02545, partial [Planctomycetes bacterium]|nr:hypothetical protein [Planctomycetota bacterium]
LLATDDSWFRPVALHFGPDGCLYVVDWYNAIISHNEVPRSDPRRDKVRSRVWRIRHESMKRATPVDLTRVASNELVAHLDAASTWEARAAWHQLVDRGAKELVPELRRVLDDSKARPETRILALWSLESLGGLTEGPLHHATLGDPSLEREAVRASVASPNKIRLAHHLMGWPTPRTRRVRFEMIEAFGATMRNDHGGLLELFVVSQPPRFGDTSDDRYVEFERSLIRVAFEKNVPSLWASTAWPDAMGDEHALDEGRALFALALGGVEGAKLLTALRPLTTRSLTTDELALLAAHVELPEVRTTVETLLADPKRRERVIDELLARGRDFDATPIAALVVSALEASLVEGANDARKDRLIRATSTWRLEPLVAAVEALASDPTEPLARRSKALSALMEHGKQRAELCAELARAALPGEELQRSAALALAALKNDEAARLLFETWRSFSPVLKRSALDELSSNDSGARVLLAALERDDVDARELDAELVERLRKVGAGSHALAKLDAELARRATPTLACFGGNDDGLDTDLTLAPPFTLEAWVELAEPITNADGILGRAGSADFNFADRRFRFYGGPRLGDLAIAKRALEPETWSHVAATCDATGAIVLYLNAEADAHGACPLDASFAGLDVARTSPDEGTRGRIAELRVWKRAKSALEIGNDFRRRTDALESRGESSSRSTDRRCSTPSRRASSTSASRAPARSRRAAATPRRAATCSRARASSATRSRTKARS